MGEPSQEIFDVVRAGDTGRLQALLTANPSLANARNERGHSPVLIAQYHHKTDAVAVLLAARTGRRRGTVGAVRCADPLAARDRGQHSRRQCGSDLVVQEAFRFGFSSMSAIGLLSGS